MIAVGLLLMVMLDNDDDGVDDFSDVHLIYNIKAPLGHNDHLAKECTDSKYFTCILEYRLIKF